MEVIAYMNGLPNFISVPIFFLLLFMSIVCIFTPIKFVQALFIWPRIIKHISGIEFPAGGDEILSMVYKEPSLYMTKYKKQLEVVRLMGFIGIIIAVVALCKLLGGITKVV